MPESEHVLVEGTGRETGCLICTSCHLTLLPADAERHCGGPASPLTHQRADLVERDPRESSVVWTGRTEPKGRTA